MRPSTAALSAATLLAGVAGGSVAYERASSVNEQTPSSVTTTRAGHAPPRGERRPRVRWAPCEAPAVLRGRTCVTAVVRTVVLPTTVAAAGTTTTGAVVAAPTYQGNAATPVPGDDTGDDNPGDDDSDDDRTGGHDGGGDDGGDD